MQNLDDMNIGERFQFDRSIRLLFGMHPVASRWLSEFQSYIDFKDAVRPLHRQPVGAARLIPWRYQQFYSVPIHTGGDAMN